MKQAKRTKPAPRAEDKIRREDVVIARDKFYNAIMLVYYEDSGKQHIDLQTDGRCYLTPELARRVAAKLTEWAGGEK